MTWKYYVPGYHIFAELALISGHNTVNIQLSATQRYFFPGDPLA